MIPFPLDIKWKEIDLYFQCTLQVIIPTIWTASDVSARGEAAGRIGQLIKAERCNERAMVQEATTMARKATRELVGLDSFARTAYWNKQKNHRETYLTM